MSRQLDLLIEDKLFGNTEFFVENEIYYVASDVGKKELPYYSSDVNDAYKVLDRLKMSTLIHFNYMYLGEHIFDSRTDDSENRWYAKHKDFCCALCLAGLYSINCDKEEIRDALFSYNYYYQYI